MKRIDKHGIVGLPRAIRVTRYSELSQWIAGYCNGTFSLLFVIGRPGLGKSQLVRNTLGDQPHGWIECHVTAMAMYRRCFECRDRPLCIDDEATMLKDGPKVALMNALCQTNPVKTLRWDTSSRLLDDWGVPPAFTTTSPVLVITNQLKNLNPQIAAMIDRGQPLVFEPSAEEIHEATADWFTDREIYDFIANWLRLIPDLSMRDYVKAKDMKSAGMDWRSLLLRQWRCSRIAKVATLRDAAEFTCEEERVQQFIDQGLGSRATYFRDVEKLRRLGLGTGRRTVRQADSLKVSPHFDSTASVTAG